jgi:hypothetical protein
MSVLQNFNIKRLRDLRNGLMSIANRDLSHSGLLDYVVDKRGAVDAYGAYNQISAILQPYAGVADLDVLDALRERMVAVINNLILADGGTIDPPPPLIEVARSEVGVEALGQAGTLRVSIQNDTPTGGVIVADSPATGYAELRTRVTLLESSLVELRRNLDAPAQIGDIGIGHNQGPPFAPISPDELLQVDELIALLKDRGPDKPIDSPVIEQSKRAQQVSKHITDGVLELGKELSKGGAREAGKEMLAHLWTSVSHWIDVVVQFVMSLL